MEAGKLQPIKFEFSVGEVFFTFQKIVEKDPPTISLGDSRLFFFEVATGQSLVFQNKQQRFWIKITIKRPKLKENTQNK